MSPYSRDLWGRACKALLAARRELAFDPDLCASRSYYAAFYAVSALFAIEGQEFTRHSAVEAAVHRDLVRLGRWAAELGSDYSNLCQARNTGDYGIDQHVSDENASAAVAAAERILRRVSEDHSAECPLPPEILRP